MNKVTTINLNGKSYQIEEDGYAALSAYLEQAEAKLMGNPDKEEIMNDFEQAVAEKFQTYLHTAKDVVTTAEVQAVLAAMGPVEGETSSNENTSSRTRPHRMTRIREGSIIFGVCTGIASYFRIEVTLVRILFVLLALATSGGFIFLYIVLSIFLPSIPAATGASMPYSAHEFIQHAQTDYSQFRNRKEWKQWRRASIRNRYTNPQPPVTHAPVAFLYPFLNILRALLLVVFIVAFISLVKNHTVFGIALPHGVPILVAIILLFALYRFITLPLQWAKYRSYHPLYDSRDYVWQQSMFWHAISSVIWFVALVGFGWFAYTHIPSVHTYLLNSYTALQQNLPQ